MMGIGDKFLYTTASSHVLFDFDSLTIIIITQGARGRPRV